MTGPTGPRDPVLDAIRRRRVVRAMTDQPVDRSIVEGVLDAARWAPTAGNRHLQRFVATDDARLLRVLRAVCPGMIQRPAAAITVCVDRDLAADFGFGPQAAGPLVDVGTAAATMLLAAQALGVGAGPVTSFSRAAVGRVLDLPTGWVPEMIICLGHPAPQQSGGIGRRPRLTWRDLTRWVPADPTDTEVEDELDDHSDEPGSDRHDRTATLYEAAGGEQGLLALAHAWHERVLADEVVAHAFSHGFRDDHSERLAAYWVEALGGPPVYSTAYGDESEVVRMHSGNGPHDEMDARAIACFDQALVDTGLDADPRLAGVLHDYFAWATRETMGRFHGSAGDVPDGMTIPRWGWAGLIE